MRLLGIYGGGIDPQLRPVWFPAKRTITLQSLAADQAAAIRENLERVAKKQRDEQRLQHERENDERRRRWRRIESLAARSTTRLEYSDAQVVIGAIEYAKVDAKYTFQLRVRRGEIRRWWLKILRPTETWIDQASESFDQQPNRSWRTPEQETVLLDLSDSLLEKGWRLLGPPSSMRYAYRLYKRSPPG